ncbi:MAG: hypothetical protein AAB857_00130 [Patescibacteria group bacterium]|mgnify:CR=1 FL=1
MKVLLKIGLIFGVTLCLALTLYFSGLIKYDTTKSLSNTEQPEFPKYSPFKLGEPIEISKVKPAELTTGENNDLFYIENEVKRLVVNNGNPISQMNFSPTEDRFGYLVNYDIYNTNIAYDRTTILYVEDIKTRKPEEVFHGSFRTSGWEWFSMDEILVSEGCGTECRVESLIDLKSGKKYTLQYGVGYTWSPDKKLVFAYNYSYKAGITVGDKYGNIKFQFHIGSPESEMANTPLAAWSPDSSKIALVTKIEGREEYELSIFSSRKKFMKILQTNIDYAKEFELKWAPDNKSIELNNKKITLQ